MDSIWKFDLCDLAPAMIADMCDGRVKPWKYLPVYPDFDKMSLIREILAFDDQENLHELSKEEVRNRLDSVLESIFFDYDRKTQLGFDEIMSLTFRPYTKDDPLGFCIEYDSLGGIGKFTGPIGNEACPYPLDPLGLEMFLRDRFPDCPFVKSSPNVVTFYDLPSGIKRLRRMPKEE